MINPAINPIPFRVWNLIAINLQLHGQNRELFRVIRQVVEF